MMVWTLQIALLILAAIALILNLLATRDANADLRALPQLEPPLASYLWVNIFRVWCRLAVSVLAFVVACLIYLDPPPPPYEHGLAVLTFGSSQFVRHLCIGGLIAILAVSTIIDWRVRVRLRRMGDIEDAAG
jgi:hypothetical protein